MHGKSARKSSLVAAARAQELEKVGAYLQEHGPWLGGEAPSAADAQLGPMLYHAKHALKHFRARPCARYSP